MIVPRTKREREYCNVPNWFLEAICAWPGCLADLKVFMYGYRHSWGWIDEKSGTDDPQWRVTVDIYHRDKWARDTGLDPATVSRSIRRLVKGGHFRQRDDQRIEVSEDSLRRMPSQPDNGIEILNGSLPGETDDVTKRSPENGDFVTLKCRGGHSANRQLVQGQSGCATETQYSSTVKDIKASPTLSGLSQLGSKTNKKTETEEVWEKWTSKFPVEAKRNRTRRSWPGKILQRAKLFNVDPFVLIDCVLQHSRNPRAYLLGFGVKYPLPEWAYNRKYYTSTPPSESVRGGQTASASDLVGDIVRKYNLPKD